MNNGQPLEIALLAQDRSKTSFFGAWPRRWAKLSFFIGCAASLLLAPGCKQESTPEDDKSQSLLYQLADIPFIGGRERYLPSPSLAAGDRLYVVGHQDGSFPDLGWHVPGEMGGVWAHPIKLLDGYRFSVSEPNQAEEWCLPAAERYVSYPLGNLFHYQLPEADLALLQWQFVPDGLPGLVIELHISNLQPQSRQLMLSFHAFTELHPVWLGERTGMADGPDMLEYQADARAFVGRDEQNPWYVAFGSDKKPDAVMDKPSCQMQRQTENGAQGSLSYRVNIPASQSKTIRFYVAGSDKAESEALDVLQTLRQDSRQLLSQKMERYQQLTTNSFLFIPDPALQRAFNWMKYNTDWLVQEVPGIGRGLTAGIPDYPWWFGCDNSYALQGALAIGQHDLVKSTMLLIDSLSRATNGNGRIMHEASTNGAVFNEGNINETPHFVSLVWKNYAWTGDRELLETLWPTVEQGMKWLLTEGDPDGNGYPNGFGMMEIHGLNSEMIDVASYTCQALGDAAKIAEAMGQKEAAKAYQAQYETLKTRINQEWWVPEARSFADFRDEHAKTLQLAGEALVRADTLERIQAKAEIEKLLAKLERKPYKGMQPQVLYHNWVVNTPLETGIADPEKAAIALQTARQFVNPFGVYVTGIDKLEAVYEDLDAYSLLDRKGEFNYTGAVMTLPTGVQALAEARYGQPDAALAYLQMLERSFSFAHPGSMYEVSPDYGMLVQAWNVYALAEPIVSHFFGFQPEAWRKRLVIAPNLPKDWDDVALQQVLVGDNRFGLRRTRSERGEISYSVGMEEAGWEISLQAPEVNHVWTLNGEPVTPTIKNGKAEFTLKAAFSELKAMPPTQGLP